MVGERPKSSPFVMIPFVVPHDGGSKQKRKNDLVLVEKTIRHYLKQHMRHIQKFLPKNGAFIN